MTPCKRRQPCRLDNREMHGGSRWWIAAAIFFIFCFRRVCSLPAVATQSRLLSSIGTRPSNSHEQRIRYERISPCFMKRVKYMRSPPSGRRESPSDDEKEDTVVEQPPTYDSASSERHHTYNQDNTKDETAYNFWHNDVSVDVMTRNFNMDLQNLALEDAMKAEDALYVMEQLRRENVDSEMYIQPNSACYTTVIDGWLHSNDEYAAEKAQALLDRLEGLYDATGDESLKPNAVTYMLVCQVWADACTSDYYSSETAERAWSILERMKQRGVRPTTKVYTSVLHSWCKGAGKVQGAMRRAEEILCEMEESYASFINSTDAHEGQDVLRPNVITYTTYISGLARSKEGDLATKAEQVLTRMEQHGVQPDVVTYTSVLNAYSRTKSRHERQQAAKKAVEIMRRMESLYQSEELQKPSLITYATAINAIGNSLDPNAPEIAENMLRHLYQMHESKEMGTTMKPTTATFNAVITAMARSKLRRGRKTAQRAEALLVEMFRRTQQGEKNVEPNVKSWGSVMLAWSESNLPDAAENAQRVLDKMEALYRNGDSMVEPNVVCYTTVMGAWCRVGQVDRAEEILKQMEQQFAITGHQDLRPNSISYLTVIDGFVRQNVPNAAQRAQETVDRMMRLYAKDMGFIKPSKIVYNTLINAYSRSTELGAALKAEQILQWMETQYREARDMYCKPDEITFCGVLNSWANHAKNGGAERAQQILEHMESLTDNERGFPQTVICYNIVLKAWARSGDANAIQHAERIFGRMERRNDVRPDTTTYSSLINCCAYYNGPPKGRKETLAIALRTFEKLCKADGEAPNNIVYGTLFKALNNLAEIGKDRDEMIRKFFRRCCEDGQVDGFVLKQLRNAASTGLFRELVSEPARVHGAKGEANIKILLRKMPRSWSRNVD